MIRPEFDGEADEVAGRLDHALLVAPAQQHLDADDRVGAHVDLGLEGAAEAPVADRQPQPLLDRHAGGGGVAIVSSKTLTPPFTPPLTRYMALSALRAQHLVGASRAPGRG